MMKKKMDEADDSILKELIASCESKMSSKFAKEEEKEAPEMDMSVESESEDDMDEGMKAKLLELYRKMKD